MKTQKQVKKKLFSLRNRYILRNIAKELGISPTYVSYLLSGKRNNPELLNKIQQIIEG